MMRDLSTRLQQEISIKDAVMVRLCCSRLKNDLNVGLIIRNIVIVSGDPAKMVEQSIIDVSN